MNLKSENCNECKVLKIYLYLLVILTMAIVIIFAIWKTNYYEEIYLCIIEKTDLIESLFLLIAVSSIYVIDTLYQYTSDYPVLKEIFRTHKWYVWVFVIYFFIQVFKLKNCLCW